MELTFSELKKRDVINISDGRCLGRIIDLKLCFPDGVLTGIAVPGKRRGLFSFFDKSQIFIGVDSILKIGGDVILVDLRKGNKPQDCIEHRPEKPCPPPKRPPQKRERDENNGYSASDFANSFGYKMDDSDY